MPSTCKFILNKPNAVYYSGENISGQAIVNITFVQDVRNVRIFVLGEAKIKWCEHAGRHTTYYKSHETYIDNGTNLRIENVLQPGTYTYNFDIALPPLCPTSCECKYGFIRYVLSLKLKGPFGLDNFVFKKPLTVLQKVDLNLHRDYKSLKESEHNVYGAVRFLVAGGKNKLNTTEDGGGKTCHCLFTFLI